MKTIVKIKTLFFALLIMVMATACNNYVSREEHEKEMNDLSANQIAVRDSIENMYLGEINDIQNDLGKVRSSYSDLIIAPYSNSDANISRKDRVIADITTIASILENNKSKIAKLEKRLSGSKKDKLAVEQALKIAKENLEQQELQLADVKRLLNEKDIQIGELNDKVIVQTDQITTLQQNIAENTKANNVTYVAVGTPVELKQKKIIKSEGGVFGIKKVDVLNDELNKSDFEQLDKTEVVSIPLGGTHPVLVTHHPKESYEITGDKGQVATLTIKDPDDFWKLSKYLVVEVKQ